MMGNIGWRLEVHFDDGRRQWSRMFFSDNYSELDRLRMEAERWPDVEDAQIHRHIQNTEESDNGNA